MAASTRTGNFGIGFRRGWSDWQHDIGSLVAFAKAEDFACLDVKGDKLDDGKAISDAGLAIGSVDLPDWRGLISPEADERRAAVDTAAQSIANWAAFGPMNHFLAMLPKDPSKERAENFEYMAESFRTLSPAFEEHNAKLVIEGWPGPGALCCTPESIRAFFAACPSPAMGLNYDPSHLIRMGIDPIRFLREFADRCFHAHGKDTELYPERDYDTGREIGADHTEGFGFGGLAWRYTIPGHGAMRWVTGFEILRDAGYTGLVSIELEDQNFNGSEAGEKAGLIYARDFLKGC